MDWSAPNPHIELYALIVLAVGFGVIEHFRPARTLDWKRELVLDIVVFLGLIALRGPLHNGIVALLDVAGVRNVGFVETMRALPPPVRILLGVVFADFMLYWIHRSMHTWAFLWRTHLFHHAPANLNWLSGFRASLPHTAVFAVPQALAGFVFLNFDTVEAGVAFSIGVFFQLFAHVNFDVPLGPLEYVIATPQYHRVHHAADMKLGNMNHAVVFPVWDILFRTYFKPSDAPAGFPLGLDDKPPLARQVIGL